MNVRLSGKQSTSVSVQNNNKIRVSLTAGGIKVPGKFRDLNDFDATNLRGNNIITYDADTQRFKTISIDDLLAISAEDGQLPEAFTEQISDDIDLDAGEF